MKMFDEDTLEDSSDSDDSNDTLVDPLSGDAEDDDNDELETFEESNNLELQQFVWEEEEDESGVEGEEYDETQQLEKEEDPPGRQHHKQQLEQEEENAPWEEGGIEMQLQGIRPVPNNLQITRNNPLLDQIVMTGMRILINIFNQWLGIP